MSDHNRHYQLYSSTYAELEEFALVEKSIQGDQESLCKLCDGISKSVYFQLKSTLDSQSDIEDVSQNVLMCVCDNIRNLRNPKAFRRWLSKIVITERRLYLAKFPKSSAVLNIDDHMETLLEKEDFLPHVNVESQELRSAVMEAISGLPLRQKEAVMLHYYEGLNVTETAASLGVAVPTASEYLALARKKIKHKLENHPAVGEHASMHGAMPVGVAITSVLQQESAILAATNAACLQSAVAKCHALIYAEGVAGTIPASTPLPRVLAGFSKELAALACACMAVAATAVIVAVWPQVPQVSPAEPSISVEIVFSGYGAGYDRVDPAHAVLVFGEDETATPLQWWVTAAGSEAVLYEGYGGNVNNALTQMQEHGLQGEFILSFRIVNEEGVVFRLSSNFYLS